MSSSIRTPVIFVEETAVSSSIYFDVNSWSNDSKGLIQSAWSEYSALCHCITEISSICSDPRSYIQHRINTIKTHLDSNSLTKDNLDKIECYAQYSRLHIYIEAFFSSIKSLLDLLSQLLSTENIVGAKIDGFHRKNGEYGGKVLSTITNNAIKENKDKAEKVHKLISSHKSDWIDNVISARDQLVHPNAGMHQLMFKMVFEELNGKIEFAEIRTPMIGNEAIESYVIGTQDNLVVFITDFIAILRNDSKSIL